MNPNNITKVYLLNVPLENDYKNTLYFENKNAQQSYFQSKIVKSYTNFSYQRKDSFIRVPDHFDNLQNVNYVMYQNSAYSNKWFYAFVTDIKYVDDGRTDLIIETDYIQTWLFDYTVKPSFVEREHVSDDGIGSNTVPEQVEHGPYICNKHTQAEYSGLETEEMTSSTNLSIIVGVTQDPDKKDVVGAQYNNIYSGIEYYAFSNNDTGIKALNEFILSYGDGKSDAIVCMFLAPKVLVVNDGRVINSNLINRERINSLGSEASSFNKVIDITTNKVDSYVPRNNKLLTFPYRYLLTSNNSGSDVKYHYEDFYTIQDVNDVKKFVISPTFEIQGCLTVGCSIRMIPLHYKGIDVNHNEGINLGKFPALNWTSDVFTNWVTQNAVNIGVNGVMSLAQIGVGAATFFNPVLGDELAGGSMIASGVSSIANTIGEVYKHAIAPPQSEGNLNCGDVITASNKNDFHFYDMSIKSEYAKIIDGYFDLAGYKINTLKQPNAKHRSRYWYTKTIDVNIDGAIPMKDMQKIKDCYNQGITFWVDHENVGTYPYVDETGTLQYENKILE